MVALLSIDFHALETDVRKEISLRTKVGSAAGDSVLVPSLNLAPALEFERSDATRRLRLVLSELIVIMGQVSCQWTDTGSKRGGEITHLRYIIEGTPWSTWLL